ncbi:sensor histidine kinase [Inhella sp.]|uniref:sensor histidine kinase n=1 Tax=Inhella sp. TaxID=1921806 RepID=UPI0035AF9A18
MQAPDRPFLQRLMSWPRWRTTLGAASVPFVLFSFTWQAGHQVLAYRIYLTAIACLLLFTLLEQWPRRLPRRVARWVLQALLVTAIVPPLMAFWYWFGTEPGAPPFYKVPQRMEGFFALSFLGVIVTHWTALAALFRERDARIVQAERARGELEREAVSARLRQLQAQVEPHFLFNTLANVQALVDAGSPQASPVLASLVAYLRAAVPRLNQSSHLLGQELEMTQAYLHLMQLRMPDRLQYRVYADPAAAQLACPPMTLLTLVENAVRHGIDPSLAGGRIEVAVRLEGGRCRMSVRDTGVGLQPGSKGLGTGLATLRERLRLMFGDAASVRLSEVQPHGVLAEVELPA